MDRKVLAIALAVAAFVVVFSMTFAADASESESNDFDFNESSSFMKFMNAPMEVMDGKNPGNDGFGPREGMKGHMFDNPPMNGDRRPLPLESDDGRKNFGLNPNLDQPRYNHDADPETMMEFIEPMMEDVSKFDPAFVEDVIEYAEEHGMSDVARRLAEKLAENYARYMDVLNDVYSLDTRASGVDDDQDDNSDFELVDEEDEEDPQEFSVPNESIFIPFLQTIDVHTLFQYMQLDI